MGWEILWPLILGFALSGVVQAVVTKAEMSRLLPDSSPRSIVIASALGAASSSCSYAAVALARSIFRRGADFVAAMAFQFASTNLVIELGIIVAVLIGWQFVAAEFAGGLIMVALLTVMLRAVMTRQRVAKAKQQADRGLVGRMEGHAAMDMSVSGEGSILARITSPKGFTAISHFFVMDWAMIWIDIALGLLIAGALAAIGLVKGTRERAVFKRQAGSAAPSLGTKSSQTLRWRRLDSKFQFRDALAPPTA
jgi:uncharacterized membrane protein YraQ (UPF0718 family)